MKKALSPASPRDAGACVPPGNRTHRIAVFSDTHDRFPPGLPALLASADELWHLGDVCAPATLVEFEQLGLPMAVVRGNNDSHPAWPLSLRIARGRHVFHLEHIAPRRSPGAVHFILSGHTHVPSVETDAAGVHWLNPGCISRPRAGVRSFAWLSLGPAGEVDWENVLL